MKRILLIAFIFVFVKVEAQNMVISFSSTNPDEKIDYVLVQNLSQGKSVILKETTNLELAASTVTTVPIYQHASQFKVYPNPVSDVCYLQFENIKSGSVVVGLYDLNGKQIISQTRFLEQGVHQFQLTGLPSGISAIKIDGAGFNYTNKIISTRKGSTGLNLKYVGESINKQNPISLKNGTTNVLMQYNMGERLKYSLYSNGNKTVQTDVPTESKTVLTTFYEVKDADGNRYATVQIGTQTWMLENLKTTKYNDGTAIPNITDITSWSNLATPSYCWYNNDIYYKNPYGVLYNWYTVNTGKLAPKGWHVPTDNDWTILVNYLIANGYNYDGSIVENKTSKSLASTTGWTLSSKTGTPGAFPDENNSTGFAAPPGGYRANNGRFYDMGKYGVWWGSTYDNEGNAICRYISYNGDGLHGTAKEAGFSVRCVKN